jgi:hypothetical protein
MGLIFKLLGVVATIVTTVFLIFESGRRGMLILATILGLVKLIVLVAFLGLLAVIFYLLLASRPKPPDV